MSKRERTPDVWPACETCGSGVVQFLCYHDDCMKYIYCLDHVQKCKACALFGCENHIQDSLCKKCNYAKSIPKIDAGKMAREGEICYNCWLNNTFHFFDKGEIWPCLEEACKKAFCRLCVKKCANCGGNYCDDHLRNNPRRRKEYCSVCINN